MSIKKKTKFGAISISNDAIADVAADAALSCYGVVGIVSRSERFEKVYEFLKKGSFSKGVFARQEKNSIVVDLYVIVAFGVKITEVLSEVQKRIKYVLEKTFESHVKEVNVFAQNLKKVD